MAAVLSDAGYSTALFHSGRFIYLGMEAVIRNCGFATLEDAGDIGGHCQSSFGVDEPATVARILRWIDALPCGRRFFVTYLPIAGHHPYETGNPARFPTMTNSADTATHCTMAILRSAHSWTACGRAASTEKPFGLFWEIMAKPSASTMAITATHFTCSKRTSMSHFSSLRRGWSQARFAAVKS
jgi:hypothetical protein